MIYIAYYMLMQKNDPRREAAMRIVETSRLLRSLVEQRLKPFGTTRAQVATLARLEREEGLSQNEMAESLELAPIAMVRIVDQLERDHLVERRTDPADRRCNLLFITDAGRKHLASLESFKTRMGAELFDGIGEADIRQMLSTLDRLHANIKTTQAADAAANKLKKAGA
jgi:MarR family transcriptional regulator, transcriptional regulator for hemolysin